MAAKNIVEIVLNGVDKSDKAFISAKSNLIAVEKLAKTAAVALAAFAAAAVGSAAVGVAKLTKEAIDTADATGRLAQQSGIAVEQFSALAYSANLAEVDANQLKTATKALADEMVKAGRGNESVLETILATADAFAGMEDGATKTNRAVQLFGKSGQDLIPLLNQGSAAIRAQMAEAEKFGKVIGADFAGNADEFNDNLDRLKASFEGVWLQVADKTLPSLVQLSETLLLIAGNKDVIAGAVNEISTQIYGLSVAARAALDSTRGMADILMGDLAAAFAKDIGSKLKSALKGGSVSLTIDEAQAAKARKLLDEIQRTQLDGYARLKAEEEARFGQQLENIAKLQVETETKNQLVEAAQKAHFDKMNEMKRSGEGLRAEMDAAFKAGDLERFHAHLLLLEQAEAGSLEKRQELLRTFQATREMMRNEGLQKEIAELQSFQTLQQTREALLNNSLLRMRTAVNNFSAQAAVSVSNGLGQAVADIATGAQDANEAFANFGKQVLSMLVKFAAQLVINAALQAVLSKVIGKTASASATSLAGAWGAAATAASIATLGGASAAGAAVVPMMAVNAGLGAAIASSFGGMAHGGMDYVPREATYLLQKGEAVLQPDQNADLREFLAGRGAPTHVAVYLDSRMIGKGLGEMSRDGRLVLDARSIV